LEFEELFRRLAAGHSRVAGGLLITQFLRIWRDRSAE
jgi:hypothetical protein